MLKRDIDSMVKGGLRSSDTPYVWQMSLLTKRESKTTINILHKNTYPHSCPLRAIIQRFLITYIHHGRVRYIFSRTFIKKKVELSSGRSWVVYSGS